MKPEKQVCSSSLAIRLKQLGVKQHSLYYWYTMDTGNNVDRLLYYENSINDKTDLYSAFTVAELGEMLPSRLYVTGLPINTSGEDYFLKLHKDVTHGRYSLAYETDYDYSSGLIKRYLFNTYRSDKREANARAQILILILENNCVSLEDINKNITDE